MASPGPLLAIVLSLAVGAPIVRSEPKELALEDLTPERTVASVVLLQSGFKQKPQSRWLDSEADHEEAFHSFVSQYKRAYMPGTAEFEERFEHFRRSAEAVAVQNSGSDRLWDAAINELSDWSAEELKQLRGWQGAVLRNAGPELAALGQEGSSVRTHQQLPTEFRNWTRLQAAKDIPDQGSCGSCWAVTSATVLRAHSEIYRSNRTFSAQELLNCVHNPLQCGGSGGCRGATAELAFDYAAKFGLDTEHAQPYRGIDGVCRNSKSEKYSNMLAQDVGQHLKSHMADLSAPGVHHVELTSVGTTVGMRAWERLPENKYEPLKRAVVEYGPVAVSVAADRWNHYASGIFDSCPRNAVIDHAVTLLGYGQTSSSKSKQKKKFWIVQNSWGSKWGESGHIRILREDKDDYHCGTDSRPQVGTACKGGPASVKVCGMCGIHYDSVVPHFQH